MDKKQKQTIGISLMGIGAVGVVSVFGYWYYYKKLKEQAKIDEMVTEGEKDITENYQDDRPRLSKFKDAIVNKLYPKDYRILPKIQQDLIDDLYEEEKLERERLQARRVRFTVFDSVQDRFKILETHGDKGVAVRGTGRLRPSGDIYKRTPSGYDNRDRFRVSGNTRRTDIPSEYGNNNRNKANISNITELDIPVNVPRKRIRSSLIYPELR